MLEEGLQRRALDGGGSEDEDEEGSATDDGVEGEEEGDDDRRQADEGPGFDVELCISLLTGLGRREERDDGTTLYIKDDDCVGASIIEFGRVWFPQPE